MNETLEELNTEEAKQHIGGVVFVSMMMVVGFVGNLHVLLVYSLYMKPSNHRLFILVLGCLDFITCIVGMPFIIVDLRHPLTFTLPVACKVLRFINYFISSSSALMLTLIAADRYRKICVPLGRQISQTLAKLLVIVVLLAALFMSWPAPILYGASTVQTTNPNINGTRCYTEDKHNFSKYQAYFNEFLIFIVFAAFIVLTVLYVLIWRVIRQHGNQGSSGNKELLKESSSTTPTTESLEMTSGSQNSTDDKSFKRSQDKLTEIKSFSGKNNSQSIWSKFTKEGKYDLSSGGEKSVKFSRAKRTTLMFLLITTVFFLSYFPHLALKVVAFMKKGFVENLPFPQKVAYNTFVWCFFLNNIANCFIYGFVDLRFRRELIKMYRKLKRNFLSVLGC